MQKLTNDELIKINGGALSWQTLIGIVSGIVFIIGVIDGIVRPLKCYKMAKKGDKERLCF